MSTRSDSAVPLEARPLAPAVDLMALVRGMWRRKLLWFVIVILAVGAALAVLKLATPRYSAGTMVLIGSADAAFANLNYESTQPRAVDERQVASQEQVIRSRELALRVVDSLGPDARAELGAVPDELSPVKQAMIDAGFASDPRKVPEDRRVMEAYYEGLTVYALPNSNAIAIQFTAADPELAAAVANAVADNYVTYTRDIQLEMTGQARDWLAGQIEVLRAQVSESEKAVETYRAENGLVQGSRASLDTESLTELNNQIVQAAATSAEARARADAIRDLLRSRGTVDASLEVLNSNLIQRLTEQQVTLKAQLADLSTTYLPSHPRIEAIEREIGDLDRQIRSEALKIADGLEQQARIAAAREASLRNSLEELKADASSNSLQEVELRALEREAEADRTLLQNMLTRYGDASTREGANAQPALARVISHAEPPLDPSFPRPVPLLGLALAGGAMVGLVLVFLLEVFSPSRVGRPAPAGRRTLPRARGGRNLPTRPMPRRTRRARATRRRPRPGHRRRAAASRCSWLAETTEPSPGQAATICSRPVASRSRRAGTSCLPMRAIGGGLRGAPDPRDRGAGDGDGDLLCCPGTGPRDGAAGREMCPDRCRHAQSERPAGRTRRGAAGTVGSSDGCGLLLRLHGPRRGDRPAYAGQRADAARRASAALLQAGGDRSRYARRGL
ncbi:GumC family protein [Kaustia mangrovi]|uniref:GumC family protein n=1 Tax=Kaustia mangrovi TaxID=2593653 RepID=A0A7S8C7V6_9HYPH|nr:GumC family protein [Kaustia mangrovi]QPC44977.1 GumC family protein [Kaustia mangrovi]